MKIAVSASGPTLDSMVDPRFGRCAYFIFVDTDTMQYESIPNPAAMAASGAGIQAAQLIVSKGVKAVVTGNVGPNAGAVLSSAGVQIIPFNGTVRQAVEAIKSGNYTAMPPQSPPAPPGGGFGPGPGWGRGGGWGRGRGGGFGRGGPGPGRGGGFGRGGRFGKGGW